MRRQLVSLTSAAEKHISKIVHESEQPCVGVRLSLKRGGCAGMEYDMALAQEVRPQDEQIECGDTLLLVSANASMFLVGSQIDYRTDQLESGFVFNNPNVIEACGCGESVSFAVEKNRG